ncbi:MAG: serine/threonine-protein kinase [Bdellovibrionales bacterium]|nr:serine/threonine-protein kinase [Bdellovibrionales bacterium]
MTISPRTLQEGHKISSYVVRRKLGSGGMGDVYLCDDPSLGRQVAVKVMHSLESDDPEAVSRFILEGKALAKLTHPNIVSVYGLGEENGLLYIAMEYVQGHSLFQHSRDRKLSINEMIGVFSDVAKGLDHAHSAGIIHRDIKPANILVDGFGRGKIIDFGIAKSLGGNNLGPEGVKTKTGVVIGTLNYIAPELFRGDPPSPLSDIYALGLCFFEMLTGRTPFKGESQFSTMEKIRACELDIPENLRLILPEEFWKILYHMIAADPAERTPSASAGVNALKAIKIPELPQAWTVPLASVRLDNLMALQSHLEELGIDHAEWQFILSAALKRQSERPKTAPIAVSPNENGESTAFIEATGVVLLIDNLDEAVLAYKADLEQILTSRRATRLEELTPPPTVTGFSQQKSGASTVGPATIQPTSQSLGQSAVQPTVPSSGSSFKWVAAIAIVGVCVVGYSQYLRWQKDQSTKAALQEAQRVLDEKAAKLNAQRGEKVLAPVAKGFAMVIEPSTDAWPPIAWQAPEMGAEQTWNWTAKDASGKAESFTELRTFVAEEDGLLKFKIGESLEWYQAGFSGIPRRASSSAIFGGLGGTVIGQPEMIFPLRKGKEVHFELVLNQTENVGTPTHLKLGANLKLRGSCVVGDKANLQVKTSCSFKSDSDLEVSLAMTWDEARKSFVKQEYRLVKVGGDQYIATTLIGEESSQASEVRTPTSF